MVRQWLEVTSTEGVSSMMALSSFAINAREEQESPRDIEPEELENLLANSPLGMATSNTSLLQVTGCNGGSAIFSNAEGPLQDSLLVALSPELRVHLPRGPNFRFFRPPRVTPWMVM